MNFAGITQKALDTLFKLGGEYVKTVTYVRPPGANPLTGAVSSGEVRVTASAVVPNYKPAGFSLPDRPRTRVVMRASALAAVALPGPLDYILLPDATRLDVLQAALDFTSVLWIFECRESPSDDRGSLVTHGASEDRGDLTPPDSEEDYGALW